MCLFHAHLPFWGGQRTVKLKEIIKTRFPVSILPLHPWHFVAAYALGHSPTHAIPGISCHSLKSRFLLFFTPPKKAQQSAIRALCPCTSRGSPHRNTTPLALRNQLTLKPGKGRTENRRSCSPSPSHSSSVLRSTAAEPPILQIQGRAREPNPVYSFTCETRHHTPHAPLFKAPIPKGTKGAP